MCDTKYDYGKVIQCTQETHINDLRGRAIHSFSEDGIRLTWKEGEPGSFR